MEQNTDFSIPGDALLQRRLWAELVAFRGNYTCHDCGRDRKALKAAGFAGRLNAHHLDEDDTNNVLNNGMCLCNSCHQKRHVRGRKPCAPGCTCGNHTPHGNYPGAKPCEEGCTCRKHDHVPAFTFEGGSNPCSDGCTCRRHTAMIPFRGPRAEVRECSECPRLSKKLSRGMCPACYQKWMRNTGRIGRRAAA